MKEINEYLFNVYNLIYLNHKSGLLERPKKFHLCKEDKKILNIIWRVYKIYRYSIGKKAFQNIVIDYSLSTKRNIIESGNEVAEEIQKIIKK